MGPAREEILARRRRVYLARHGEVSYFDEHGHPFRPDTVPLNDEGRRQAQATAELLREVRLDRIVSSDLPRCVETATILADGRPITIETNAQLREIQPGHLREIPLERIWETFTGALKGMLTPESRFLGGESFASLLGRVLPAFDQLLAEENWSRILIVAHGAVNRAILTRALQSGLAGFGAVEQDAACLNIVDVDPDGAQHVRLLNHSAYNPAKQGLELTTMERLYFQYLP